MGERLQWARIRERAAGKWQIPSLFFGLAALGLSLATYRSPASKVPFESMRAELASLVDRGMYAAAIESAGILLAVPDRSDRELAPVHAAAARARLLQASRSGVTPSAVGRQVIEQYQLAAEGGYQLDADDLRYLGTAYEWAGDVRAAVTNYDASLALHASGDLDFRRHVAELRADYLGGSAGALEAEVDRLIADAADRPDILAWAVDRKIDFLCDGGRCDAAVSLVDELSSQFGGGRWRGWFEYLASYARYRSGADDEAELRLRRLRQGLTLRDELYARSGWLLGRVLLGASGDERPVEAATFFQEVAWSTASPVYAAAAELGLADSMVSLERFDEALGWYEQAAEKLKRLPPNRVVNRAVIETSLTTASEMLRRRGRLRASLRFAEAAVAGSSQSSTSRRILLLGRLAATQVALARRIGSGSGTAPPDDAAADGAEAGGSDARTLLLASARIYRQIESLSTMDEQGAARAAWLAAQRTNESGDAEATVEAMERFIRSRPESPMIPRALRYLGQAQQSLGRYAEAVESYQENLRRFARTPDAGSSLIPLARCFIAMGPEYGDRAQKTLRLILDDSDVFTPQAPEYADALFLLGELLNRSGACEEAIPVFEEAIERYGGDRRVVRARFLLGDCYRQSGLGLNQDYDKAVSASERKRLREERDRRLGDAARVFERMVSDYENRDPGSLSQLDAVYLRYARLYIGDCYFELGQYDKALSRYEQAAWMYKGTTTALAAYVQIINCHVFSGNRAEAAAALRRALYLVETTPDSAFAEGVQLETRDDWRRYFKWVAQSNLF